jgi:glycosyltransferase involved in cell wall biosynthesis
MLRIVHLQKLAGIGGAEKHLSLLLPQLIKEDAEIHYVYLEAPGDADKNTIMTRDLRAAGVQCHCVTLRANIDPLAFLKLIALIRKLKPTLLHTHLIHGDFYGACLKWVLPQLPLISTKHGYDEAFQAKYELQKECLPKLQNRYYHLSKFSIQKANHIICISKGLQDLFEGFPGAEEKISTIYYGYIAPPAVPEIQPAEYLLYIGRLIPFKHPEMLIQAYIQYRNSGGHLPLRIAGDGSEAISMQQALKDVGYHQDVLFMGRIPRPEDLLSKAACLCVSSFSEGFGLVILEAMAASVPVIAFDGPAMNETIHHGVTGTLCPVGDAHAFAQAMQKYSQHPEIRTEHGKKGWEKLSTMRIDTMATQTLSLYKKFVPA